MGLIYVTGISGAGKTTVCKSLSERGYESYDVDHDGFAAHYNKATGEKVDHIIHTREWHDKHEWKISRQKAEELAKKAHEKPVFLCGVTSNDNEVWNLFELVIALTIDEATIRNRLATRESNEFGKSEDELQMVLEWHKYAEEQYRKFGAKIVDTTQPIERVVDEILKYTIQTTN